MSERLNRQRLDGTMYRYFRRVRILGRLLEDLPRIELDIEKHEEAIRNNNVDIDVNLRGIEYSDMPKSNNGPQSSIEQSLMKASDRLLRKLEWLYEREEDALLKIQDLSKKITEVDEAFKILDERLQTIIKLSYYDGLSVREIAKEIPYSKSTIQRDKDKAIKILERELKRRDILGQKRDTIAEISVV